ncbi:MAG: hypothetical protein ACP5HQ_06720 [Thermoprotei archaeon]
MGVIELNVIVKVLRAIAENAPDDCSDVLDQIAEKFVRDVKDLGLEKAILKWYGIEDEQEVIIESP